MTEQDIPKITFQIRYKHFKFMVMLFRPINALVVFMDLRNRVFHDYLDKFIMIFIDDIIVYFKSDGEYQERLRFTLQRLREKQLYAKFTKCSFGLIE